MKDKMFIYILLLIGVVCLFSCNGNSKTNSDYNINHYIDTINGHVILSTVVDFKLDSKYNGNVSIATLELNNIKH